jgi:hypothetical protein
MANILGTQTLDNAVIILVDANPSAGAGTPADLGSIATVNDGTGLYLKTGVADTAWTVLDTEPQSTVTTTTAAATTLKENLLGPQPRAFASGLFANISLICVHEPVYVAGFDLGVRPIGD